jgi:Ca2+/H+ antiporter, TMEM165/GDT1 family
MAFALTALGAALACGLELLEAMAIVLAVALTRRPRDAVIGAVAAVLACVAVGIVLGPLLLSSVSLGPLRLVVGVALLLFGLEWLRKAILRLAGRRARSDSFAEFEHERAELEAAGLPPAGRPDWAGRVIAFKGVLLEGMEVILIVTALASRPGGGAPALLGAGVAALAVVLLGAVIHRPLRRVPETELKYLVGLVLTTFGTFFTAEGLDVHWPLGDAALLVLLAVWLAASRLLIAWVGRPPSRPRSARTRAPAPGLVTPPEGAR